MGDHEGSESSRPVSEVEDPAVSTGRIDLEVAGGVAALSLNRPDSANAFDLAMAGRLTELVPRLQEPDVQAVLVTGAGRSFCAGGDVAWLSESPDAETRVRDLASTLEATVRALGSLPKPVVVGVHGAVAGAGLAFLLNADYVVCARSTRFVPAYTRVGLSPDCGVSWLLPRVVGQQRAVSWMLTGTPISAQTALEWGLVTELVDDELLVDVSTVRATTFADGPTGSFAETKRLIRGSWGQSRAESAADEVQSIARRIGTPEAESLIRDLLAR
jgi:2-(1,2-epoxy-1,2-dihydrophenyl)acetyl-CoA isomerase